MDGILGSLGEYMLDGPCNRLLKALRTHVFHVTHPAPIALSSAARFTSPNAFLAGDASPAWKCSMDSGPSLYPIRGEKTVTVQLLPAKCEADK